jgi:hypothetical protein
VAQDELVVGEDKHGLAGQLPGHLPDQRSPGMVPSKRSTFRLPGPRLDLGNGDTRAAEKIPAHPHVPPRIKQVRRGNAGHEDRTGADERADQVRGPHDTAAGRVHAPAVICISIARNTAQRGPQKGLQHGDELSGCIVRYSPYD